VSAPNRSGQWRRIKLAITCLGVFLGGWLVWSAASLAVATRAYIIPTGSMAPTLMPGDRVGVEARPGLRPERGEVWVFRMPKASGVAPNHAVKRVVGLPGETVEVTSGKVLINGRPLAESYLAAPMTYTMSPMTLGADAYLMLGDSRDASHDGHVWGPLPADHLVGRVKVRFWPPRRVGGL
jgi:signal peptidase I